MNNKNQPRAKFTDKDYEKMGRTLELILESGFTNHKRLYRINFLRGILFGFGSVIGGTIVVAMIAWLVSFFDTVPLIGGIADAIKNSLQTK